MRNAVLPTWKKARTNSRRSLTPLDSFYQFCSNGGPDAEQLMVNSSLDVGFVVVEKRRHPCLQDLHMQELNIQKNHC